MSNVRDTNGRLVYDYEVFVYGSLWSTGTGMDIVEDGKFIFGGTEETWAEECSKNASQRFCSDYTPDPATIAQNFYKATHAGDLEAAMALVAEDVICRGGCYLTGKEAFRSYIQGSINLGDGGRVELSDLQVEGDKVTYRYEAYNKDGSLVDSGVETLQIKDGKIIVVEILQ